MNLYSNKLKTILNKTFFECLLNYNFSSFIIFKLQDLII